MINEVNIQRLDELIGDFNTPFFNYLLYSYDLSLDECEGIVEELKNDINSNKIVTDNIVSTLDTYFRAKVTDLEKQAKLEFLFSLIQEDNDFYIRYLEKYNLDSEDINLIYGRVESKILEDNISDFEIKRYLEYYFANAVKQVSYINDLNSIVGNDYDTLIIKNVKKKYPILLDKDIIEIVFNIHGEIIEAKEFKKGIKHEFKRQCLYRSEDKKAQCRKKLEKFVEGSGDSFSKLIQCKKLTKSDGERIVSQILEDISNGLIQPEWIDGLFITRRFNDYNERQ
jgi:adenylate kinase family enzyme